MAALLDLPEPPDAVFCCNDLLAIGAIRTALDRGLAIPEDLAVIGFDDTEEGRYSYLPLTTIAPDKSAIARAAVDLAHRRRTGAETPGAQDVTAPFRLKVRASTAGRHPGMVGAPDLSAPSNSPARA